MTHEFHSTKVNCVAQRTKWKPSLNLNSQMSIREKLHDTEFGNDFSVLTGNTQETIRLLDFMETWESCASKDKVKRMAG